MQSLTPYHTSMTEFKIGDRVTWKTRLSGRTIYCHIVRETAAGGFYGIRHDKTGFEFLVLPDEIKHAH